MDSTFVLHRAGNAIKGKMSKTRGLPARGPIYGALRSADGPMTAYQVLDAVRRHGISAPPTVYRALNRLVEEGLAHRVESINAYVACAHTHHDDGSVIFAICDQCGLVDEIDDPTALESLQQAANAESFHTQRITVEVRGRCHRCQQTLVTIDA